MIKQQFETNEIEILGDPWRSEIFRFSVVPLQPQAASCVNKPLRGQATRKDNERHILHLELRYYPILFDSICVCSRHFY